MRLRLLVWFAAAQILAGLFVFRDAIWGASLLAPIDIYPALFSKFRSLDPTASRVPANHHIIDQATYDLPLQRLVYDAYQRGETPWWDPYTLSGRPLIADAHISAADPVRWVMYRLMPFEMAYNWARIAHYLLFGLGMWLLLLRIGFQPVPSLLLAIACQYSSGIAMFFGHPWIHASFVYYPFLWLAWMGAMAGRWWAFGLSSLLVAAAVFAGNLQSHAYLGVFGVSFFVGYGLSSKRDFFRCGAAIGASGLVGAMLAAPLLAAEWELFRLNARAIATERHSLGWLSGLVSVSSMFPWGLGSFSTLDVSKAFGRVYHLGFAMFIGTAAFWLSCLGAFKDSIRREFVSPRRAGLCLVGSYLVIVSTPLHEFLYMRSVPLAVIGLTVLAASGWEYLRAARSSLKLLGWIVLMLAALIAIGIHIGAFVVFSKFRPRIEAMVARASTENKSMDHAPELRAAQIQRFPTEVSFLNPEASVGFLGLVGIGALFFCPQNRHFAATGLCILVINLIPLLMFSVRYIPRQPVEFWHRLQLGTKEHQRVLAEIPTSARVFEIAPGVHERLFPNAISCLYQVRMVQGYAALAPSNYFNLAASPTNTMLADKIYSSAERGLASGVLASAGLSHLARFYWSTNQGRQFRVVETNLCQLSIQFEPGAAGQLIWNDTRYPGWSAKWGGNAVTLLPFGPVSSAVGIPAEAGTLELVYSPTGLRWGAPVAWAALMSVIALIAGSLVVEGKARR